MTKDERINAAANNALRFREYAHAESLHNRLDTSTAILLGDDNRFWVPVCMADASRLIKAGYEEA